MLLSGPFLPPLYLYWDPFPDPLPAASHFLQFTFPRGEKEKGLERPTRNIPPALYLGNKVFIRYTAISETGRCFHPAKLWTTSRLRYKGNIRYAGILSRGNVTWSSKRRAPRGPLITRECGSACRELLFEEENSGKWIRNCGGGGVALTGVVSRDGVKIITMACRMIPRDFYCR